MQTIRRTLALSAALVAAALSSACVVVPSSTEHLNASSAAIAKMGEQAVATCGAGNVKEVNAKSYSCK